MQQTGHKGNFLCWAFSTSRFTVDYNHVNLLDSIRFAHLDSVILLRSSLLDSVRCLCQTQIWTLTVTLQNILFVFKLVMCHFLHTPQAIIDYIKCLLQLLLTKYSGIFCCEESSRVTSPSLSCEDAIDKKHRELL